MRVVIADDHPLFLDGLRAWLSALDVDVVAAVRTADELLCRARADPPDVVLADVAMPPTFADEGLRAATQLAGELPGTGVLVLSALRDGRWATRLLQARDHGVGYLLKHNLADAALLEDALRRVADRGVVLDPEVVTDLVAHRSTAAALDVLTARERAVLAEAAQGRANRGIAAVLGISERTVENHVTRVFQKLGLPEGNQRVLAILQWQKAQARPTGR